MKDKNYFFECFSVGEADLDKVMARLMKDGASYSDLFFEKSDTVTIVLRDSRLWLCADNADYGVGMRALMGEKTGYAYCETTRMSDMLQAASAASAIALGHHLKGPVPGYGKKSSADGSAVWIPVEINGGEGSYFSGSWSGYDLNEASRILHRLDEMVRSRDSRITMFSATLKFSEEIILQYNSLGQLCGDVRPMGSLLANISFGANGKSDMRYASRSFRSGPSMLNGILLDELVEELCGRMDPMLEAGRPKGGKMKVVMGAGASGILLHEAMGHAFEADFVRKGQSVYAGKLGKRVCPKGISIVDDGIWKGNRGACNFDDELVSGKKTYMVSDGILTSYLHDRISAAHFGVEPTGNGRRQDFRFAPLPRMRLTYMESSCGKVADMIKSVKDGIYVDEFSNGQVKIGEGDFTFYVKLGYLIENGVLTRPIKDVNIIGNGPETLGNILEVGDDLKINDSCWICGKDQTAPVGCGTPSLLVDGLTIGGE